MTEPQVTAPAVQSRGREYVRSFLFSVKIDSALSKLHMVTKLIVITCLSLVVVEFISTDDPDLVSTIIMILVAFYGLYLGGVLKFLFSSYLVVLFPALLGMTLTWVIFNPDPGDNILMQLPIYSGQFRVGLSLGLGIFLVCVIGWYALTRGLFWGLLVGFILALAIPPLFGNPGITFTQVEFFHPMTIIISSRNIWVACTKALGYGAMMLVSLLLVMTSRDVELVGTMRQLRIPYVAIFFISTMLRSLSLALSDYNTIRQAQIARGITLKDRNVFQVMMDYARMAVPVVATMLRRSSEVGDAVMIRGFSLKTKNPTEFKEVRKFGVADWIVLLATVAFSVGVFALDLNITRLIGVTL